MGVILACPSCGDAMEPLTVGPPYQLRGWCKGCGIGHAWLSEDGDASIESYWDRWAAAEHNRAALRRLIVRAGNQDGEQSPKNASEA